MVNRQCSFITASLIFINMHYSTAQDSDYTDTLSKTLSIGIGAHYGFVFAHTDAVQNTKGAKPWAIEADFSRRIIYNKAWQACRCYPRTGLNISWFNYNSDVLGHSINASWYIEPFLSVKHRFNLSMKGAAGLSYLTNPYHETTNPYNMSYSTAVSAYLGLGLGLNATVSPHVAVKFSAYYNHISNGGIKDPNKGINWPAVSLQVYYSIHPVTLPQRSYYTPINYKAKPLRWDVFVFGSQKGDYVIAGAGCTASKQISGMNALSLGAEAIADYALKKRMENESEPNCGYVYGGILAGHEFLMGKFIFSQQLGIYITPHGPYYDLLYQRYGLVYSISSHFGVGINLKAHRQEANFIDGRIIYSWRKKRLAMSYITFKAG